MKCLVFALVPLVLFGFAKVRAQDARSQAIAPFLDNDVFAVGRLDLAKVDVDKLAHRLHADQDRAGEVSQTIAPWFAALRQAGARELYVLGVLPELMSPSSSPFPIVVPLGEGADARAIGQLLCGGGSKKGPVSFPTCATLHNAVFAGTNQALEWVRQIKPGSSPRAHGSIHGPGRHRRRARREPEFRHAPGRGRDVTGLAQGAGRRPDHGCHARSRVGGSRFAFRSRATASARGSGQGCRVGPVVERPG